VSHKSGGAWQEPVNLGPVVNSSGNELPRWISDDGRTLLFSSDRAGGQGDVDIWYTVYEGDAWQAPVNLGPAVNSAARELGASFKCNAGVMGGFIFFGSTREGGHGGLDLWQAEDGAYHAVLPASVGRVKALFR
jgi:hypothetical protein